MEEQQARDHQSLENMKRILNKAENLEKALENGDLDKQNQIMLAHALEEGGGDYAEKQRKRMVDEIIAKRQREKQQKILQTEAYIRELNEKRWNLVQAHEKLLKKRIVHKQLASRGTEFLAELEMGKIPNKDLVMKNIEEVTIDMTEQDGDANKIFSAVTSNLDNMINNIQQLKLEKDKTLKRIAWMSRPYQGEDDIRRHRKDLPVSIYTAIKDLVYDIVEDTWKIIVEMDKNIQFIIHKKEYYMHKSKVLRAQAIFYSEQQVFRLIALLYVDEILEELIYSVAEEMLDIARLSETLIIKFVAVAVIKQRGSKFSEEQMMEILKTTVRNNNNNS
jgi:hypothetical protein